MNGRENLQNVLSLVDMTKVDLPSYNISIKKYDIIASTYTKVIYLLASLELRVNKQENDEEAKHFDIAKKTIMKISKNPLIYSYENAIQKENALVKQATEDLYGYRVPENSPQLRNVQNSVKKSLMIKNMKEMLNSLRQFGDSNAENVIEFCMSDENFEHQLKLFAEVCQEQEQKQEIPQNCEPQVSEAQVCGTKETSETKGNEEQQSVEVKDEEKSPQKTPLWKRLFGKK